MAISFLLLFVTLPSLTLGGLLGAGSGTGSCRAPPYRCIYAIAHSQVPWLNWSRYRWVKEPDFIHIPHNPVYGLMGTAVSIGQVLLRAVFFTRSCYVQWDTCPSFAPCCSEFGYCRTKVKDSSGSTLLLCVLIYFRTMHYITFQEEWWKGSFRDCNGESNGTPLPQV